MAIETASGKELNWTQTWLLEEEEFFANTDNLMRGFEAELAVVAVMFQEDYYGIARQQEDRRSVFNKFGLDIVIEHVELGACADVFEPEAVPSIMFDKTR